MSRFNNLDATELHILCEALGDHVVLYGVDPCNTHSPQLLGMFRDCPSPYGYDLAEKVRHYCMDPKLDTEAAEAKCVEIVKAIEALS